MLAPNEHAQRLGVEKSIVDVKDIYTTKICLLILSSIIGGLIIFIIITGFDCLLTTACLSKLHSLSNFAASSCISFLYFIVLLRYMICQPRQAVYPTF